MNKTVKIGNRLIGNGQPCYVVAEMSANHGGNYEQAVKIIQAAKEFGADAVKIQTYRADTITLDCDKEDFLLPSDSPWKTHQTLYSLYQQAFTPWEWHKDLFEEARKCNIEIFSSPFDTTAVDLLESLNAPAYKVASPEITDIPLLERIAATKKPVILSTGISELADIELAVSTLKKHGCYDIILLKCTTAYPAPLEEVNLRTIPDLASRFDCISGLSDHTLGLSVPIAAIAVGASFIEKHYILDHTDDSEDAFFSLDTNEFKALIKEIRNVELALGKVSYEITPSASKNLRGRRSLYVSENIKKGELFTNQNIKSVRPSFGLHPKYLPEIIGKQANQDLTKGDRVTLAMIKI